MLTRIIHGDCLEVALPKADCVFLDPPDNLSKGYFGYLDNRIDYFEWLKSVVKIAIIKTNGPVWISHFNRWTIPLCAFIDKFQAQGHIFIWRYTFGQHRTDDCGYGYRPILRVAPKDFVWNTDAIRVPSARQLKYHDKRANPKGRVPDDTWEFPRICGTYKERRGWCPNQHPIALMERIVAMSCNPGQTVCDYFGGTFSTARACMGLGINSISVEIDRKSCELAAEELGLKEISSGAWESEIDVTAHTQ